MIKYKYNPGDLIQDWMFHKYIVLETAEYARRYSNFKYGKYKLLCLTSNSVTWYVSREFEKATYKVA